MNFNPRSREGSDVFSCSSSQVQRYFNPRSREGSDLCLMMELIAIINFNPRSREGSDLRLRFSSAVMSISIHAQ